MGSSLRRSRCTYALSPSSLWAKKVSQTNNLAKGQNCFGWLFLMSCVSSVHEPKNCGQNNTLTRHVERVKCSPTLTCQIITRSITCRRSLTLLKPFIRTQQSVICAQLKDTQIAGSGPINMLTEPFPHGTPTNRTAPFPRAFFTCLLESSVYDPLYRNAIRFQSHLWHVCRSPQSRSLPSRFTLTELPYRETNASFSEPSRTSLSKSRVKEPSLQVLPTGP